MAVKSSEIYFDICIFLINALTAQPGSYHLIAALPSNFAECTFSVNNAAVSSTLVLKEDVDSIIWYRQVWMHSKVNADTFL